MTYQLITYQSVVMSAEKTVYSPKKRRRNLIIKIILFPGTCSENGRIAREDIRKLPKQGY